MACEIHQNRLYCTTTEGFEEYGRWATRTPDLWFRRPTLYPPELIAHKENSRYSKFGCFSSPWMTERSEEMRRCIHIILIFRALHQV